MENSDELWGEMKKKGKGENNGGTAVLSPWVRGHSSVLSVQVTAAGSGRKWPDAVVFT